MPRLHARPHLVPLAGARPPRRPPRARAPLPPRRPPPRSAAKVQLDLRGHHPVLRLISPILFTTSTKSRTSGQRANQCRRPDRRTGPTVTVTTTATVTATVTATATDAVTATATDAVTAATVTARPRPRPRY